MIHELVNKYERDQSFEPHTDYFAASDRVVSAVDYLNTVAVGGDTTFIHNDNSVSPVEGRVFLCPSNYLSRPAGIPPASGTKYSAAFWARG